MEGLTANIFRALFDAAGFIVVLHKRGYVSYERGGEAKSVRASVFVEQEIALAAFMQQLLGRPLHVAAFIESDITLEGVREHIILNPIRFSTGVEILNHLREILPKWTAAERTRPSEAPLALRLGILRRVAHLAGRTEDKLVVYLHNKGSEPISNYWGEVSIPKGVVETPSNAAFSWIRNRSQGDHDLFRFTQEARRGAPIYPGDEVEGWSMMFPTAAPRPGQEASVTLTVPGYPPSTETIEIGEPPKDSL